MTTEEIIREPQWWLDAYAELERGGYCDSPGGMECARVYHEFLAAGSPLVDAREFIVRRANALPDGSDGAGLVVREHMRKLGRKGGKRSLETMTAEARLRRSRKAGKASGKARKRQS